MLIDVNLILGQVHQHLPTFINYKQNRHNANKQTNNYYKYLYIVAQNKMPVFSNGNIFV